MAAGRTILCIDDYPIVLNTLGMVLERFGFRVLAAHSREEALDACRRSLPDAVLLEFRLCPGCSDTNDCLAELIRKIAPRTKVLVWSADGRSLQQPPPCAAATFVKPMDPQELVKELETVLKQNDTQGNAPAPSPPR